MSLRDKSRVLFVTPEAPFPILGGGSQRIASLIEYARHSGAEVDLLTFSPCPASAAIRYKWEIPLPPNGRSLRARVMRNAGRFLRGVPPLIDRLAGFEAQIQRALAGQHYDAILVEHFWLAPYVDVLQKFGTRVICDLHNIESEFFRSLTCSSGLLSGVMHTRFARLSEQLERSLLPRYTGVLVTSEADAKCVARLAPSLNICIFPNTIPWLEIPHLDRKREIVFSGNMEYHPNQQAVSWFYRQIWPALREEKDLRWRLVGMNPHAVAAIAARDGRIEVTGAVCDAIPEIARAQVAVVPLLSGSGTRVKILEAWAAGTPVVSTRLGAAGLPVRDGEHLLLADTPEAFSAAVKRILQNQALADQLRAAGRALYERQFHREAAWRMLDASGILGEL